MSDWLVAFVVTLVLELPVVVAGTRGLGLPLRRRLLVALAAQAVTHPLVWFVFPKLPGADPEVWFWVSELVAVLFEGTLYDRTLRGLGAPRALALSAIANAVSLGAGIAWEAL